MVPWLSLYMQICNVVVVLHPKVQSLQDRKWDYKTKLAFKDSNGSQLSTHYIPTNPLFGYLEYNLVIKVYRVHWQEKSESYSLHFLMFVLFEICKDSNNESGMCWFVDKYIFQNIFI